MYLDNWYMNSYVSDRYMNSYVLVYTTETDSLKVSDGMA